jgi:hypothetical protein
MRHGASASAASWSGVGTHTSKVRIAPTTTPVTG